MSPKCVETIDHLPHAGKEIVRPFGKPEDKVHNRNRYGFCSPADATQGSSRSRRHGRCRNVSREKGLMPQVSGQGQAAKEETMRGTSRIKFLDVSLCVC